MEFVDTHAHLNFEDFRDDWESVVERAGAAGVSVIVVVGIDLKSSQKACQMAACHPAVYASIGIHPSLANDISGIDLKQIGTALMSLSRNAKVVAIGEIGLDYHQPQISVPMQKELLTMQVSLAKKLSLPILVHVRGAQSDILPTLHQASGGRFPKGVFHCFSGSKQYLSDVVSSGFFISFTSTITYSHGVSRRSVDVPLERLLLESDAPFMSPVALRGQRNEPISVTIIAEQHAKLRRIQLSKVASQTTKNAKLLFRI